MGQKECGFMNTEFGENTKTFRLRCDHRSDESDRVEPEMQHVINIWGEEISKKGVIK